MTKKQLKKEYRQLRRKNKDLERELNVEIDYGCALFDILRNRIMPALEDAKEEYNKATSEHLSRMNSGI